MTMTEAREQSSCASSYGFCLKRGCSWGLVGDEAVVLDLESDRYVRLGRQSSLALLLWSRSQALGSDDLSHLGRLRDRGILSKVPGGHWGGPVEPLGPCESALEVPGDGVVSVNHFLLSCLSAKVRLSLRTHGLAATVRRIRYRRHSLPPSSRRILVANAQAVSRARVWVPFPRACLPDALAQFLYFQSRGIDCDVEFGVRLSPFAAHSWVRSGTMLLSDPAATVADFSPVFKL